MGQTEFSDIPTVICMVIFSKRLVRIADGDGGLTLLSKPMKP